MKIKTYIVLSGSMEPNIKIGDLIIVKEYKIEDIQKGDIITFEIDDKIITHRIIEIKDGKYITKGDNNNVEDDFSVRVENIKGKFVLSLPKIGDLMLTIKNNIYIFLISLIIIIIYEIKK